MPGEPNIHSFYERDSAAAQPAFDEAAVEAARRAYCEAMALCGHESCEAVVARRYWLRVKEAYSHGLMVVNTQTD